MRGRYRAGAQTGEKNIKKSSRSSRSPEYLKYLCSRTPCRGGVRGARNEVEERTVGIGNLVGGFDHRDTGAADAPGKEVVELAPEVAGELQEGRKNVGLGVDDEMPPEVAPNFATTTPEST